MIVTFPQSCIQVRQCVDSSDSTTKPYSQEVFHKQMLKILVSLNLPFRSADNIELRKLLSLLCPNDLHLPKHSTMRLLLTEHATSIRSTMLNGLRPCTK